MPNKSLGLIYSDILIGAFHFLSPLLNIGPFWAIFILSFLMTLFITLIYKFGTNQKEMKYLKEKMKEYQKNSVEYLLSCAFNIHIWPQPSQNSNKEA